MRNWISLVENAAIRLPVWSGGTITVLHNPKKQAFENFIADGSNLRGLLSDDGNDLYIWKSSLAVHPNIMQELQLGQYNCIFFRDGKWKGPNLFDETGVYQPAIQRITPRDRVKLTKDDNELLRQLFNENISRKRKIYYHGSSKPFTPGFVLLPQGNTPLSKENYSVLLEKYRPSDMLSHYNSVFMTDNMDDLDNVGASIDYVLKVYPLGNVERHDMNWSSELICLLDEKHPNQKEIEKVIKNYWDGIPHYDENLWEYLTPSAKVISCEKY